MSTPRVLLTGATGGLGLATARALRATGTQLFLASRDVDAARRLVPDAEHVHLDLADLRSVDACAQAVAGDLDAVVLNAGIQVTTRDRASAQGLELTFAVNQVANARLATHLRGRTRRIVLVASGTHRDARLRTFGFPPPRWDDDLDALATPGPGSGRVAYATSKLANVLWVREATRRWPAVHVCAHDPGLMPGTGLARDAGAVSRAVWERVLPRLLGPLPGVSTPERSGAVLASLALGTLAVPTGAYVDIDRVGTPDPAAQDDARARALFDWSPAVAG